jgi:Leucine-rich repeat (LRR) protein
VLHVQDHLEPPAFPANDLVRLKEATFLTIETNQRRLPDEFSTLNKLKVLVLHACAGLQSLPESVRQLAGLALLDLSGCTRLQSLPESIGHLAGLVLLDLGGCRQLERLPDSIGQLSRTALLGLRGVAHNRYSDLLGETGYCSVSELVEFERRREVTERLLGDRDARRQSLDSLSVVAVLFATAAFVAFASAPGAFNDGELFAFGHPVGVKDKPPAVTSLRQITDYYELSRATTGC